MACRTAPTGYGRFRDRCPGYSVRSTSSLGRRSVFARSGHGRVGAAPPRPRGTRRLAPGRTALRRSHVGARRPRRTCRSGHNRLVGDEAAEARSMWTEARQAVRSVLVRRHREVRVGTDLAAAGRGAARRAAEEVRPVWRCVGRNRPDPEQQAERDDRQGDSKSAHAAPPSSRRTRWAGGLGLRTAPSRGDPTPEASRGRRNTARDRPIRRKDHCAGDWAGEHRREMDRPRTWRDTAQGPGGVSFLSAAWNQEDPLALAIQTYREAACPAAEAMAVGDPRRR